jgi:4-hydroxyacetophenone monooxygenase
MLMDNGWYRMLRNERVKLVADPIVEIGADRVITKDGAEYEADVLVVATGFDVLRFLTAFEARGRSGQGLREVWEDDNAKAYLGTTILIFVVEMQMRYIMDVLKKMLTQGLGAVECRQDVHDAYNERIDQAHANMVWTHPGMETYYRNARGRIVVNSPYRNTTFYEMTRTANLGDFVVEPRQS